MAELKWRKASNCGMPADCIELAETPSGEVAVRDSKDGGRGAVLVFTKDEMRAFIQGCADGEFNDLVGI